MQTPIKIPGIVSQFGTLRVDTSIMAARDTQMTEPTIKIGCITSIPRSGKGILTLKIPRFHRRKVQNSPYLVSAFN